MSTFSRIPTVAVLGLSLLLAACAGDSTDELIKSARAYLAKNDGKAAIVQLKNVLQLKPDSAEARFLLGKALLDADDPVSASVELRKALDLNQPALQVAPLLARSLLAEGQYQKLVDQFAEVDLPEPAAVADLKSSVATAYAALGKPEKSRTAVAVALQAVPDYPQALMLQARLAADERKFAEASALIEKVIAATPSDAQAWVYKGELLFLGNGIGNGDTAGAAAAYRKALSIKPNHAGARSHLIALLLGQRDLIGAAEQIGELRKTQPRSPRTMVFDAQLALLDQNPKKALESIQQARKSAPDDVRVLQLAGAIEFSNGLLLEAERSLGKALQLAPNSPFARRKLAQTLIRLGQPAKALTVLQPLFTKAESDAQTYSLAGEAYLLTGDLSRAEANFAKAVKIDPKNTGSRTALALTKLKSDGLDATTTELRDIASTDVATPADFALVSVYLGSKDFTRALKAIDAIEAKQPNKAMVASLRGRVQLMRKDAAEARRSFERALAIDPLYIPAATSLASLDLADKRPVDARKRFESVLAIDPKNLRALLALAEIRSLGGSSKEEIAGLLTNAVKLNPTEPEPRLLLVNLYLNQRDAKSALTVAQDAAIALPDSTAVLDALGRAQMAAGETNQAIQSFNKLVGMEPESPQAYVRLAGVHVATRNTATAEQNLRRALAITPSFLPAQQALFDIAIADKRPQDALLIARTIQKQRPDAVVGFMLEGAAEASRNNLAAAAEVYRNALKKFPSTQPAVRLHSTLVALRQDANAEKLAASWTVAYPTDVEFLAYLGELAMARGNYAAAETRFRNAIAIRPDIAAVLNNLALVMVKLQKPGALAFAERADKVQPDTPALMDTLATALAGEKQIDKALEVQKKALALAPSNPVLKLNLARLYIESGNKAAARVELETIVKLGDKFAGQAEVDRLIKAL